MRVLTSGIFLALVLLTYATAVEPEGVDGSTQGIVDQRIAAGEFAAAQASLSNLPSNRRDTVLAQIAAGQSSMGDSVAAGRTVRQIGTGAARNDAIDSMGSAGGGSFADFQSLMDLIQTTIVPDTWEALGGPSTLAPYPQGVYVDAKGTLQTCETTAANDAVEDLKQLLARRSNRPTQAAIEGAPASWRRSSPLRCVSLRRLNDAIVDARVQGQPLTEAMIYLAGLSKVQFVVVDQNDVLLIGPVGGIDSHDGWFQDRKSGLHPIRLDFLRTCMNAALTNQPFGCTIDPTTAGLQRAATVAAGVQSDAIPIGQAADRMADALGMQRVEVFGTAGDSPIGYLMVEADRHMKELALGIHPMPEGAKNYLDIIDQSIQQGPPKDLLLRLWFTAEPQSVRRNPQSSVFEIAGRPIRLSGQNERAVASGQRGHVTRDFRTEAFVADFNQHWHDIRTQYPIYGALESVYRAAGIAELMRRYAGDTPERPIVDPLANMVESSFLMPTPRQVASIATLHTVRQGRQRHHVVIASGGVAVSTRQAVMGSPKEYASLTRSSVADKRPPANQHWWWD